MTTTEIINRLNSVKWTEGEYLNCALSAMLEPEDEDTPKEKIGSIFIEKNGGFYTSDETHEKTPSAEIEDMIPADIKSLLEFVDSDNAGQMEWWKVK